MVKKTLQYLLQKPFMAKIFFKILKVNYWYNNIAASINYTYNFYLIYTMMLLVLMSIICLLYGLIFIKFYVWVLLLLLMHIFSLPIWFKAYRLNKKTNC